jgi:hypothetical protein
MMLFLPGDPGRFLRVHNPSTSTWKAIPLKNMDKEGETSRMKRE